MQSQNRPMPYVCLHVTYFASILLQIQETFGIKRWKLLHKKNFLDSSKMFIKVQHKQGTRIAISSGLLYFKNPNKKVGTSQTNCAHVGMMFKTREQYLQSEAVFDVMDKLAASLLAFRFVLSVEKCMYGNTVNSQKMKYEKPA